jgi:hypothetical protein
MDALFRDETETDKLRIGARPLTPAATCPACGTASARVNSRYRRTLTDLPSQGRRVEGDRLRPPLPLCPRQLLSADLCRTARSRGWDLRRERHARPGPCRRRALGPPAVSARGLTPHLPDGLLGVRACTGNLENGTVGRHRGELRRLTDDKERPIQTWHSSTIWS